jgi:acyl-CoA synthetase (AMP-forming)/AMP-acid ligase II
MWRSDDLYVAQWQLARPNTLPRQPEAVVARGSAAASSLPACPLMHGTGLFMALSTLAGAGEVVLIAELGLDPERIWREVARHHVRVLTIVGDVFARPLLDVLDREPTRFDLASLAAITSSGVTWSPTVKRGLLKHLPHVALIDSLGASEGLMSRNESREGDEIAPARFSVGDRLVVISETGGLIVPGSGEIGLLGVGGPIPLGYFKDAEKTAQTFRVVVGHRYSVPGDYARVADDGTIELLGRGSACINTGGEKVYPEEIELVLRAQPGVADCVVVGVPDERWGERVVALVQPSLDGAFDAAACGEACRAALAGYKVPRSILCVTDLERSAAGKPNYARLRDRAAALIATS